MSSSGKLRVYTIVERAAEPVLASDCNAVQHKDSKALR